MKKLFIFSLIVLVGIALFFSGIVRADEARAIKHNFQAYTASAAVAQSRTIFRITGVATASNGVFGIYNASTLATASAALCAVEGGEATSGDPIMMYDFGPEGLTLDSGSTVVITGCTVVIEYI